MKNLTILAVVLVCSIGVRANTYTTTFSSTGVQNPLSQGGSWINGQQGGAINANMQIVATTSTGTIVATGTVQNCTPALPCPPNYNDSTAILSPATGTWGQNQTVCGTVYFDPSFNRNTGNNHELEVHTNQGYANGASTGYEFDISVNGNGAPVYAGIGRWNPAVGSFTELTATIFPAQLNSGDVICGVNSGGNLSFTRNGTVICAGSPQVCLTATDTTYTGGTPGISAWDRGPVADLSTYGFTSFTATDGVGGGGGGGTTHPAANCSLGAVQAAVALAAAGDTVTIPACSATSWASALTLNVPITLVGAGIGQTNIVMGVAAPIVEENHLIHFTAANAGGMRITGISFTNLGYCHRAILADGGSGYSNPPFRIDDNSFTGGADASCPGNGAAGLVDIFSTAGLIDHNDFNTADNAEDIHNYGDGQAGWTEDVTIGGANMLIVEKNTFEDSNLGTTNFNGNSAIQSYNGSRLTFRYNTLTASQVDEHGTASSVCPTCYGARWYEIYNNAFVRTAQLQDKYMDLRAGSGVVWGNTESGTAGNPTIVFREEDTGTWPLAYQVGSGINGGTNGHAVCGTLNSSPAYTWNNVGMQVKTQDTQTTPPITVLNRDYFVLASAPTTIAAQQLSTDTCGTLYTYVPYTYPDPLIGGQTFAPNVNLNPPSLTFGAQNVGTSSASQTVTLLNNGNAMLTLNSILTGGDFSLTSTCGSTLAQNATCAIVVTFTPTAGGARSGTVTLTDNSQNIANNQQVIALTGTGLVLGPLPPSGTVFQGVVNGGMVTH